MDCYHWGSRSPETACVSAPASRLGGELPDSGSTIGDEKQRPVPRLSYHASGIPPNVAANNNNMTIRRIYNKSLFSKTERPTWNANTCSSMVMGVLRHLLEDHGGGLGVHEMA